MQGRDVKSLEKDIEVIRARVKRICRVVMLDVEAKKGMIDAAKSHAVLTAVKNLEGKVMQDFTSASGVIINCLNDPSMDVSTDNLDYLSKQNDMIEASRQVYDSVRDIRCLVQESRPFAEVVYDSDVEIEGEGIYEALPIDLPTDHTNGHTTQDTNTTLHPQEEDISIRQVYKNLPAEEKEKINSAVLSFKTEKSLFDKEVAKWDDTGNEIIVMAKSMCLIMMEMTDFTRGKGPLKTTMHVINAAKNISDLGTKLDKLARLLATECSESTTKKDLLAYLHKIVLYCHQLNITSKVKADVQNVSGNLIAVNGLDSATSLIQAAKNLMGAVVQTVKFCYVASTKYPRKNNQDNSQPIVLWRMKAPEKKPLIRKEDNHNRKVRRASIKKPINPSKALSEFLSEEY
jgi:catenin alpha